MSKSEASARKLLELFEELALTHYSKKPLISSLTYTEDTLSLEINSDGGYLRLSYEINESNSCDKKNSIEAILKLNYTSQDLNPIKGRIVNHNSYQGTVEALFLMQDSWYFLNPADFMGIIPLPELLVTEEIIIKKILEFIFGSENV